MCFTTPVKLFFTYPIFYSREALAARGKSTRGLVLLDFHQRLPAKKEIAANHAEYHMGNNSCDGQANNYQLFETNFDSYVRAYEERFEPHSGPLRPVVVRSVEDFLSCGRLQGGFARIRCDQCHKEHLLAFSCRTQAGPLTDPQLPISEQEALANLFAGAIGLYKNPQSHRRVLTDAVDAAEIIGFASQLLRIIDRLRLRSQEQTIL